MLFCCHVVLLLLNTTQLSFIIGSLRMCAKSSISPASSSSIQSSAYWYMLYICQQEMSPKRVSSLKSRGLFKKLFIVRVVLRTFNNFFFFFASQSTCGPIPRKCLPPQDQWCRFSSSCSRYHLVVIPVLKQLLEVICFSRK